LESVACPRLKLREPSARSLGELGEMYSIK
jgi:hypothetical protein